MSYIVRPLITWPGKPTSSWQRKRDVFKAGWSQTVDLLERELHHLNAKQVVLEMAVRERDIRNDGMIRADARPSAPGVVLRFTGKHGPMTMPCDKFTDWQANVRAIALSLEALRKVDRYGVTQTGEQYTGWKALPEVANDIDAAALFIASTVSRVQPAAAYPAAVIKADAIAFQAAYRIAVKVAHPDAGGSHNAFIELQRHGDVLRRHHKIE
jgi:hypothetical protein